MILVKNKQTLSLYGPIRYKRDDLDRWDSLQKRETNSLTDCLIDFTYSGSNSFLMTLNQCHVIKVKTKSLCVHWQILGKTWRGTLSDCIIFYVRLEIEMTIRTSKKAVKDQAYWSRSRINIGVSFVCVCVFVYIGRVRRGIRIPTVLYRYFELK